jgi:hypothetical protein
MSSFLKVLLGFVFFICPIFNEVSYAATYYVHPQLGDDGNVGTSMLHPLKTLDKASMLQLEPGDRLLLAAGHSIDGMLRLEGIKGTEDEPIIISSYQWGNSFEDPRAIIDASFASHGIVLMDCSNIQIENVIVQAGKSDGSSNEDLKCGVLVTTSKAGLYRNITLKNLLIRDIFIEGHGYARGEKEVRTANGVQRYGWGIRFINRKQGAEMKGITVQDCQVENVAHTGIKLTGRDQSLRDINIINNRVTKTGGPGIQMSGGKFGLFKKNNVSFSGSNDDSRKWGRGSGLWVWGCADIVIEHNYFLHASGPADSAGCHIDFNCSDVVVQYNFSANNAGGFCEILGNNYNCAYRYNISVNDGHRVKGKNKAFQEGKTFWLSGYVGKKQTRSGPFNSYFYNNTIYVNKDIVSKVAVSKVAEGILIANNIFYVEGESKAVMGDQYVPEKKGEAKVSNILFKNNLYLKADYWPEGVWIQDSEKLIGDPGFLNKGGMNILDYIPTYEQLILDKGIEIPLIEEDSKGLKIGLHPKYDILGNLILGKPDLGAIELNINTEK